MTFTDGAVVARRADRKECPMSRIATPAVDSATGATTALFARIKKAAGKVPNTFAAIGALQPAALGAVLDADAVLAAGSLTKQDNETVKLAVSAATGCDYCVAAHSLLLKLAGLAPDAIRAVREGKPTGDAKRDALAAFARSLVTTSGTLTDAQVAAIRAAGYSDQQLVEISLAVALTIFTNVFNRINY